MRPCQDFCNRLPLLLQRRDTCGNIVRQGIHERHVASDDVRAVKRRRETSSLADADLKAAVIQGVHACYTNAGQNCQSPTRMLIPRAQRRR